jgi:hypothetical protein
MSSRFARKRNTSTKKRKWQVEQEEEEAVAESLEITCIVCAGERDANLFCLGCQAYYCCKDFELKHTVESKTEENPDNAEQLETKVESDEEDPISTHKVRPLPDEDLTNLAVGWIVGHDASQKKKRRKLETAEIERKAAEELRILEREAEDAKLREEIEAEEARRQAEEDARIAQLEAEEGKKDEVAAPAERKMNMRLVFVSNISFEARASDLRAVFRSCGNIASIEHQNKRGLANVEFDTEEGAQKAISLNGTFLNGRALRVCLQTIQPVCLSLVR